MNSSLAEKMQRAIASKNAIKQAIINKGVDVGNVFSEYANAIDSIQSGGAELNIHYGLEAPEDTSKLWVKTDVTPSKVSIVKNVKGGNVGMNSGIASIPNTNYDIACAVVGTDIYLFNGESDTSIYKFDTITNTISKPSLDSSFNILGWAVGAVGTNIYMFKGKYGSTYYSEIYKFDTITNEITKLSETSKASVYKRACGVVGNKIYLFGGYGTSAVSFIYVFDTENESVTKLDATLPVANYNMACGVVGTKIYLFGGQISSNSIYMFDTETNTITTLSTTLPISIRNVKCGVIGTKIYLFGGQDTTNNTYLNTIYVFDTENESVTKLDATLPTSAYGIGVGAVGNKIYLFGGRGNNHLNTINQFVVSIPLNQNNILLLQDFTKTPFKLINSEETEVEISIGQAYIGNSNNDGENVECALYDGTEWEEIN